MDGWRGMHLDDDFLIWEILPDWAPFSTGLIGLGFSWEKVYYSGYNVFTSNVMCCMSLGTREWLNGSC